MSRFARQLLIVFALAAVALPAVSSASTTSGEIKIVGRVSALANRSITITSASKTLTFVARPAQLARVAMGACVQAEGVQRGGKLRLVELSREDRCAARTAAKGGGADDGPGHDRGDDHGHHGHHDG